MRVRNQSSGKAANTDAGYTEHALETREKETKLEEGSPQYQDCRASYTASPLHPHISAEACLCTSRGACRRSPMHSVNKA